MSACQGYSIIRRALLAIGFVAALLTMAFAGAYLSARWTRHRAERFLAGFISLRLGESTFEDAKSLADRFNNYGYSFENEGCSARDCNFRFWFENKWLRLLHLAPPTLLRATVGVENGRVIYRSIRYDSYTDLPDSHLMVSEKQREGPPFEVRHYAGRGYWEIYITSAASPEQRRQVFAFDLDCLSKLGGCKHKEELLPALWQNLRALGGYREM